MNEWNCYTILSKIYDVTTWLTIAITIHILPNISQSKWKQTTGFGQSMEYNKGNLFLQTSCRKWAVRLVLDLA